MLFIFLANLTMRAWFRAIAAAVNSEAVAQGAAGLAILALTLYTGAELFLR